MSTTPGHDGRLRARLLRLNALCALLHLGLTVATLSVGDGAPNVVFFTQDTALNVEYAQLANGAISIEDVTVRSFLVPAPVALAPVSLRTICALFPLLSCFFHAGNALIWRDSYMHAVLVASCNPWRWIEYSMSASVMIFVLAYFSGVLLLPHLLAITALVAVTQFFGLLVEVVARPVRTDRGSRWSQPTALIMLVHALGYVPYAVAWTLTLQPLFATLGAEEGMRPPDFVYALALVQLALFSSFGLPQIYVYACGGTPDRYPTGEIAYQWLSLIAKATLTVVLIANNVFQSNIECVFAADALDAAC